MLHASTFYSDMTLSDLTRYHRCQEVSWLSTDAQAADDCLSTLQAPSEVSLFPFASSTAHFRLESSVDRLPVPTDRSHLEAFS